MEKADGLASYLPKGDPDPNGDVILVVGPDETVKHLRVTTRVLCLASAVFSVMFGPHFAEGQDLSYANPRSLRLQHDDPEAMQCMLSVLHYRKDVAHKLPVPLLKKVALLCDKYDCSAALRPWAEMVLKPLRTEDEHQHTALWLSYVFGSERAFWKVTRNMIYHKVCIKPAKKKQTPDDVLGEGLLPDRMLGK